MRIVRAEVQSTRIPVERPHPMAIGTTHYQDNVVVKLITEDGTSGFGEAPHMVGHSQLGETPETVRVILRRKLVPAVLGLSPFDQEALTVAQDRAVPGNRRAKGAVVLAAYDLAGKLLNTPVFNLLGGMVRETVPLSWTIPIIDIDAGVEEAARKVRDGWRIIKVKVGRPDPGLDVSMVGAIREGLGDGVRIRVDANQAYSVKTALRVAREIERYDIDFLEQPVHMGDLDGLTEVTRNSPIPIMADESAKSLRDLAEIAKRRAADYVSIYVIGPGGLSISKKMASIAEAFGLRAYVGRALESTIGAAAGLHLAASSPAIDLGCEMYAQYLLKDDFGKDRLIMKDGALCVPQGPGLGIDIDEDKLAAYRLGEVEIFTGD